MIKKLLHLSALFILIFANLLSCSKDDDNGSGTFDCSTFTAKSFSINVNPIIQSSCDLATCHATGSTNGPGPLTNYAQVSATAASIRLAITSGTMPKNSSLTTAQKNSIICWIDSGAPNN